MSEQRQFSRPIRDLAFCRQNGRCAICGTDLWMNLIKNSEPWEAHHMRRAHDVMDGAGRSSLDNCAVLCHDCHINYGHPLGTRALFENYPSTYKFFSFDEKTGKYEGLTDDYQFPQTKY